MAKPDTRIWVPCLLCHQVGCTVSLQCKGNLTTPQLPRPVFHFALCDWASSQQAQLRPIKSASLISQSHLAQPITMSFLKSFFSHGFWNTRLTRFSITSQWHLLFLLPSTYEPWRAPRLLPPPPLFLPAFISYVILSYLVSRNHYLNQFPMAVLTNHHTLVA